MREIKVGFARYYNRRHNRRGYFWGDRFKSVIVDKGETLVNCLAYIDLNPLRAGMVDRPEDYRWNSLWLSSADREQRSVSVHRFWTQRIYFAQNEKKNQSRSKVRMGCIH